MNAYLASPGPAAPVHSLAEVIAFNAANPAVALKHEPAAKHRVPPASTPPLATGTVRRR